MKRNATGTHREAYPEQYSHPRCGQQVRVTHEGEEVARGLIERVVFSRFGPLAILDSTGCEKAWSLGACEEVAQ